MNNDISEFSCQKCGGDCGGMIKGCRKILADCAMFTTASKMENEEMKSYILNSETNEPKTDKEVASNGGNL